jgi:protein-disulfide isomerase
MKCFVKTSLAIAVFAFSTHSFAATTPTTNPDKIPVTAAERAKIEAVVHQYLLEKPEVIVEAVQGFQRKQMEQAEQTVKNTQKTAATFADPLFHQADDPIAGNPEGKLTITEFFDYQCPHCVDMAPIIESIIKANPDLRVVFKEFPIRGPMSDFAARAALAANKQGKYYQFSHALLQSNKPLTKDLIYQIAQKAGVNVEQMKKDVDDASINAQLKNNIKLAQDLKLFGTPAFFIGKTDTKDEISYVPGHMDQNQMQIAIDKAKK